MFERLLIANRGEIACRIIRTARRMGIETVAVYSDADADALHVTLADAAVNLGPPPAAESYLLIDRVISAATESGAQAIHPGYGFLSENATFAAACADAGLVFVGPPTAAIEAMGSKSEAKRLMEQAGVPLVPGYHGADQDPKDLAGFAAEIGYPVLIKASAGGGGKGMRAVEREQEFADALAGAKREAASSFGDDRVLIEKYLARPRHIEMQVFADTHGNVVHLFERDCSVQRRHQKVIEEAPAPGISEAMRNGLASAAVAAARAIGYVGAGTVEFICEGEHYYFMEMNTRLQVEHPVTELITGLDLVEWQLRVAAGEPLPLSQNQITADGHAFEARLYAEDTEREFLPSVGTLHHLRLPEDSARVDTGVREGDAVSPFYDPMIAKIITHGPDRAEALARLRRALAATEVAGVETNAEFLGRIAGHAAFVDGDVHTRFLDEHRDGLAGAGGAVDPEALALAALAVVLDRQAMPAPANDPYSPWAQASGWRLNAPRRHEVELTDPSGAIHAVALETAGAGVAVSWEGHTLHIGERKRFGSSLEAIVGDHQLSASVVRIADQLVVFVGGRRHRFALVDRLEAATQQVDAHNALTAPMPGKITAVHVAAGDPVAKGQALVVLEAMKMEHTITAPVDGLVEAINVAVGDQVAEGDDLVDVGVEDVAGEAAQ